MSDADPNVIYTTNRDELNAILAIARPRLEQDGVVIFDESDPHLWSVRFVQPVRAEFGEAMVQIWLIYGQVTERTDPIGLGYKAVVPGQERTYSGQRQLEFGDIRQSGLYTVVTEAIGQVVGSIAA